MDHEPATQLDQTRELANSLDFITEEDFALLARVKLETFEAWRKRGKAPPYVRLGNRFLYPREGVSKWLRSMVRERTELAASGAL